MTAGLGTALATLLALAAQPAAREGPTAKAEPARNPEPPSAPWFAFPVTFYMPETRLGFGGIGGVHFAFEPGLQTSDVQLIAVATVREQAILDLRTQVFASESLALGGVLRLAVYPDVYHGVGNDRPASARETFTSRSLEVQVSPVWYLIPRRLRTGPRAWFRQEGFGRLAPGGDLASGEIGGVGGYASAAIGWGITWDSRDSRSVRPSDFDARTIGPAAGAGARYRLTDDGVNVRLDVGMGQEGASVYFNLGEAF